MRVIVAGSRAFNGYEELRRICDGIFHSLTEDPKLITIVSGTARGADRLGERYARDNGLSVKRYPAEWNLHGKSAGYKRNELMAQNADALVAFWDGASAGTGHMIDLAKKHGLKVFVYNFETGVLL